MGQPPPYPAYLDLTAARPLSPVRMTPGDNGRAVTAPSSPLPQTLLGRLVRDPSRAERVTHVEHVPPRVGRRADWPVWVPPLLVERLRHLGVERPWEHQALAADLARGGSSV